MNQPTLNQFALWQYVDPPLYVGLGEVTRRGWTMTFVMPYQRHIVETLYRLLPMKDQSASKYWIPAQNRFVLSDKLSDRFDVTTIGSLFFLQRVLLDPFAEIYEEMGDITMVTLHLKTLIMADLRDGIPIKNGGE